MNDINMNNILVNLYGGGLNIDWKTSLWMQDIFNENGFDLNDIEVIFGGRPNNQVKPERAPSIDNLKQNGI